jgi:hypothetical protein
MQSATQYVPQPRNRTEASGEFRAALLAQERVLLERLREAELELTRYQKEVEQVRQYLTALIPIFRAEGLESQFVPNTCATEPRIGTPGNRSSNMPPRREQFTTMKLPDAVDQLLADGNEWHADNLVRAIFDVQDYKHHRAAKATLASALSAGVSKGRWDRVAAKGNTFRRIDPLHSPDE